MTQEEIIEYNKKCAYFLGWKYVSSIDVKEQKYDQSIEAGWYREIPKILQLKINRRLYIGRNHHCLKFHLDWNWIMEMVESIEKLENEYFYMEWFWLDGTNISLRQRHKQNGNVQWEYLAMFSNAENKKEAVVQAINQFLIWYNDNKTN